MRSAMPGGGARAGALSLVLLASVVSVLFAHQTLLRSVPAREAQLAEQPTSLQLVFREPIQAAFTRVTLAGPDSLPVPLGALRIEGDSATIAVLGISRPLAAGNHTVTWRTTGADGHAVSGSYTFGVLASAVAILPPGAEATPVPAPGEPGPSTAQRPVLEVGGWQYTLIRWVSFASLLGVLGAVGFGALVLPVYARSEPPEGLVPLRRNTALFGRTAAGLLLLAGIARLVAQGMTMLDASEPVTAAWVGALLGSSIWGRGWLLQMLAAAMAWLGLGAVGRAPGRPRWMLAIVGALALSVTPALSGHAVATAGAPLLAVAADTVHVLAAGGWMGGLAVLLLVGLPTLRREAGEAGAVAVARLVNAFSPPALILGGLVAGTGLVGAWLHLEQITDLWSTRYGQVLSVKLALVGVVFGMGALNFLRVRHRLGTEAGTQRLRRSAGWELTMGIIVLLVTAVLAALPPSAASLGEMHDQDPPTASITIQPQD